MIACSCHKLPESETLSTVFCFTGHLFRVQRASTEIPSAVSAQSFSEAAVMALMSEYSANCNGFVDVAELGGTED